jgi:hypothetical protein
MIFDHLTYPIMGERMLNRVSILALIGVLCLSSFAFLDIALTTSEEPTVEWSKTCLGTGVH